MHLKKQKLFYEINNCSIQSYFQSSFFNGIQIQKTVLHLAAEKGNDRIVKLLLEQNSIDINAKNEILMYNFNKINTCFK